MYDKTSLSYIKVMFPGYSVLLSMIPHLIHQQFSKDKNPNLFVSSSFSMESQRLRELVLCPKSRS